jgi:hypothetical protein
LGTRPNVEPGDLQEGSEGAKGLKLMGNYLILNT